MICRLCSGEVDPVTQEAIDEANDDLIKLGKEPIYEPTCSDYLMHMFGEVTVN